MEGTPDCNPKDNQALFKSKKFLLRVMTTRKCGLKNDDVKVWSTLVYKARDGKPITIKEIAARTGLDRGRSGKITGKARGIPLHLANLVQAGLAQKVEGGYVAVEPSGATRDWFAWKSKGEHWWKRIARYPVFALASGVKSKGNQKGQKTAVPLTQSASDLYFLLVSLAKWKDKIYGQTQAGLAKMLGISRMTVWASLGLLQELDLAVLDKLTCTIKYSTKTLHLWQDRKAKEQPGADDEPQTGAGRSRPKEKASGQMTKELVVEAIRRKYQGVATASDIEEVVVPGIARYHDVFARIGYNMTDLGKLLDALKLVPPESNEFILYFFGDGVFLDDIREAEQIHREKGKRRGASSVDMLIWKINQRFKPRPNCEVA